MVLIIPPDPLQPAISLPSTSVFFRHYAPPFFRLPFDLITVLHISFFFILMELHPGSLRNLGCPHSLPCAFLSSFPPSIPAFSTAGLQPSAMVFSKFPLSSSFLPSTNSIPVTRCGSFPPPPPNHYLWPSPFFLRTIFPAEASLFQALVLRFQQVFVASWVFLCSVPLLPLVWRAPPPRPLVFCMIPSFRARLGPRFLLRDVFFFPRFYFPFGANS